MRIVRQSDIDLKGKQIRYGNPISVGDSQAWADRVDSWGKQKEPSKADLLNEYERIAYACARLNCVGVTNAKLRVFQTGQRNNVTPKTRKRLALNPHTKISLAGQENIEEVTHHEALALLKDPNPFDDGVKFLWHTQNYQEIIGTAYWRCVKNRLGQLQHLWILPSQYVTPVKEDGQLVGF